MPALNTYYEDSVCFFHELASAKQRVLLIDYDSVIAPLCKEHATGLPCATATELLDCIMTTGRTRVVLITRRPADVLPPLAGPCPDIWQKDDLKAFVSGTAEDQERCGPPFMVSPNLDTKLATVMAHAGENTAVAYLCNGNAICTALKGEGEGQSSAVAVQVAGDSLAGPCEGVIQFLVDWLRVCGGEIC